MTAPIVVGYTATGAGRDAVTLGARLARALGARLHLVMVMPREGTRSAAVPAERSYEEYLRGQGREWLRAAAQLVPEGVGHSGHVRFAESFPEGLVEAADEFGARLIVVGGGNGGILGRHRLGTVANTLLHSSPVPVALAPTGLADDADVDLPITRVTAAVGTRAGATAVVDASVALAERIGVPLRLISLVTLDVPAGLDTDAIRVVDQRRSDDMLAQARAGLPDGIAAEVESAAGSSVEEAVRLTGWEPTEIAVVGSSRLAQPRRIFLGSTAGKMLHELPVPLIVVPRELAPEGA